MSENKIQKGKTDFYSLPIETIINMLKDAKPTDGILIVITNGIEKPEQVNPDAKCFTLLHRPESVVQGLYNHAIQFADFQYIENICQHLHGISLCVAENIDIETKRREGQN